MISEENLKKTINELMGSSAPRSFPYDRVAKQLSDAETAKDVELSAYGYVLWALDHYGYKCAYSNVLSSSSAIDEYVAAAVKYKEDAPVLLLNAYTYASKLFENVVDMDVCLKQLEGMSFPYIIYVLFAGSGEADCVQKYRPEIEEQLKRYPGTLDRLPEDYRKVKEDIKNAGAELP